MTSSVSALLSTLEELRATQFPDIPSDLVRAALDVEARYPSSADREIAQRELERLIETFIAS